MSEKIRPDIQLPTDAAQYNVTLSRSTVKPHNSQPPYLFVNLHITPDMFQTDHSLSSPCEVTSILLMANFLLGQLACMPEKLKSYIQSSIAASGDNFRVSYTDPPIWGDKVQVDKKNSHLESCNYVVRANLHNVANPMTS